MSKTPPDLQDRFRATLRPESFVCLRCIATQLGVEPAMLLEAVVSPTWSGYTFAHADCAQCGMHAYCGLPAPLGHSLSVGLPDDSHRRRKHSR